MFNKLSDKYKVVKRHKQESQSFIKKEQVLSDKDKEIFYISEKLKLDKQLVKEVLELVKFRIGPTGSEELKTNFISALKKINYEIFAKEIRKGVPSKNDPNLDNAKALNRLLKMFELDRNMMIELYNQNISQQVSDFSKWALEKYHNMSDFFKQKDQNEELLINKEKIKKIISDRRIEHLLHFTNLENKNNILKYGILSVSKLKEQKIRYIANDNERFDNMLDFISVSITNINSFLFKTIKSRYQYQNKWALCYLKPEILYEKKCYFMYTNAAWSNFKYSNIYVHSQSKYLNYMFEQNVPTKSGNVNRDEEKRKINETTCEQAEVLVKGEIAKPYIIKIEALDRY